MKVLHTADWHLGQKFFHRDRKEEHQKALNWLVQLIKDEKIELLILAGDVFDTDSPPNYARKLYYDFLKKLVGSCCRNIVVVAGNHDSPNMLDAAKELFKLLNVHVVGHITKEREEQLVPIYDEDGELQTMVGAVPYLRDRDIRKSVAGETLEQRVENLRNGIQQHYEEMLEVLQPYKDQNIPIIVTGHLFVAGGERGERQNTIHIGSLDVIDASSFPPTFDYVALGHLHRSQKVDNQDRIRYSGALIPLDFSEINFDQMVNIVEFDGQNLHKVRSVRVPLTRKLRYYKGDLDYVKSKLSNLAGEVELPTWLKIEIETAHYSPGLLDDLEEIIANKPAEIFVLNQRAVNQTVAPIEEEANIQTLSDISELEVFKRCINTRGQVEATEMQGLENTFKELLTWMEEKDVE
ncbi:MAG: exonuclease subunit SbcD [Aureispira sp.]|nr:exonuclease subunit SbcD [Aureispira sp.]